MEIPAKHKNLMMMMKICCAAVLALGLAACGSKTVAPVVTPPPVTQPQPGPELGEAQQAAMTAAGAAKTAADDAAAAVAAVDVSRAADMPSYTDAQDAAAAALAASMAAQAASDAAMTATTAAAAQEQRDIALAKQTEAETALADARDFAGMVQMAQQAIDDAAAQQASGGTTAPITTQVDAVVAAALNEPRAGSVTQSSDGGDNNVTRDLVKVTITRSGSNLNVDASYNGQTVVSTADAAEASGVEDVVGLPKGTHLYERVVEAGAEYGIEFYRNLATGDVREHDGTAVPAGQLWVDVYTDYETAGDTDYLSLGIWVYVPDGATNLDSYEYGAFADGNDPFSQNNLVSLTGTASYVGEATGVYAVKADARNYFFDAAATLTANFGAGSTLGTIEGRVHDFEVDGQPIAGNPQLMLGTANIGNSNSGFFKGDTSATFAGDTFAGKWGGQFYSNGESDGKPGSVAGTFGAGTADRSKGFLGAFGAYKQ